MQTEVFSNNSDKYQIAHLKVDAPAHLHNFMRSTLKISDEFTNKLLHFGCIYKNNQRMSTNSAAIELAKDDVLRVHQNPRRFRVDLIKYPQCLIAEHSDFIIINKPSGLPVPPTVDNAQENLVKLLSDLRREQLHVTHRLDIATSGLIFFARSKLAQKKFNELLVGRYVKKLYRATVSGEYSGKGSLTHYMEPSPKAPKYVSKKYQEGWLECRLKILSRSFDPSTNQSELEIELLTGRTHQIRTQLAHEGHPIIGDHLYGSKICITGEHEHIHLQSCYLSFIWDNEILSYKIPR